MLYRRASPSAFLQLTNRLVRILRPYLAPNHKIIHQTLRRRRFSPPLFLAEIPRHSTPVGIIRLPPSRSISVLRFDIVQVFNLPLDLISAVVLQF